MRNKQKYALGIFSEGQFLHVVCLSVAGERVRLLDARIVPLATAGEKVAVPDEALPAVLNDFQDQTPVVPRDGELTDAAIFLEENDEQEPQTEEMLRELLEKFPQRKSRLGITLSEPQIYYSYFGGDRGFEDKKLKQRVIEEITRERQNGQHLEPDAVHLVKLSDGRLMAIVRDEEVPILNVLQRLKAERHQRGPLISFVESAETSLVNLISDSYALKPEEVSVVVFLGNEYSRLIFMQGGHVYNVSYIIGAGLDSENIRNTIFSRILLEQDNLNLPQIHRILLAGEACEVNLKEFLKEKLPEAIQVEYLRIPALDVIGTEPLVSRYAVAIGAAWRVLFPKKRFPFPVNLLPAAVRENQKKFKLGVAGWMLLLLLPVTAFLATLQISDQQSRYNQLLGREQFLQGELNYLQNMETKYNARQKQYQKYKKAFGMLDAMSAGLERWNRFLYKLAGETRRIGEIWITELSPRNDDTVLLKGYSLYRNRVPMLALVMGNGRLNKVEVQEIRGRTVYAFEMEAGLPPDNTGGKR